MHTHIDKFSLKNSGIRKSIVKNLFIFISCIIQGKTVNLNNLKDEVGKITEKSKTTSDAHYKRLTRFLLANRFNNLWFYILKYGMDLLNQKVEICYLDATEWKIGKFELHILVLSIDYQGIAIPIYFDTYNHKGVLSQKERIKFIEKAASYCNLIDSILIADREFIGYDWFTYINTLNIKFLIRIRKNMFKQYLIGKSYTGLQKQAIKNGKSSESIQIEKKQWRLWVISKQNDQKEPFIYLLSSIIEKNDTPNLYKLRWKIELLFKHFKTNGYNLEDLRIVDLDKIKLIFSMLTLAFIFAILTGKQQEKLKPIKPKKYADGRVFDAVSIFKRGQSFLKQHFISLTQFLEIIQFLESSINSIKLTTNTHFVQ